MNTYANGALTSVEANNIVSDIICGRWDYNALPRPKRKQIFAYHLYQLASAFRGSKGDSSMCKAAETLFHAVIENCDVLETVDHRKWNVVAFLLRLCRYHEQWIACPDTWSPNQVHLSLPYCNLEAASFPDSNTLLFNQLRSLIRHLLGRYPLPGFWDLVWFQTGDIEFRWMDWYVDLSMGKSFRSLQKLPVSLNKKAAHLIAEAPSGAKLPQAFRWGQMRAEGISKDLCQIIFSHKCATDFSNDDVWLPLFRLFDPNSCATDVQRICTYVYQRRHQCSDGDFYQVKGKTLASINREMAEFYQQNPHFLIQPTAKRRRIKRRQKVLSWQIDHAYKDWYEEDLETGIVYSINEIRKSFLLYSEGRKMNHCVGSYVSRCMNGESSIWSLRSQEDGQWQSLVTIEVDPRRNRLVQAQAFFNSRPEPSDRQRILEWAKLNKIYINGDHF